VGASLGDPAEEEDEKRRGAQHDGEREMGDATEDGWPAGLLLAPKGPESESW
jgi:hypothetical protein